MLIATAFEQNQGCHNFWGYWSQNEIASELQNYFKLGKFKAILAAFRLARPFIHINELIFLNILEPNIASLF